MVFFSYICCTCMSLPDLPERDPENRLVEKVHIEALVKEVCVSSKVVNRYVLVNLVLFCLNCGLLLSIDSAVNV